MSEIKVVPYIPDEDYDNPAMVVDFYEFTMANCLFLNGFKDTTLVFDMFFRKNPDNQGYSISAGQRKLTRFLLNYHFNEQDVHWLRGWHAAAEELALLEKTPPRGARTARLLNASAKPRLTHRHLQLLCALCGTPVAYNRSQGVMPCTSCGSQLFRGARGR